MVTILQKPQKRVSCYELHCKLCGCIFLVDAEDCKEEYDTINGRRRLSILSINCPYCHKINYYGNDDRVIPTTRVKDA